MDRKPISAWKVEPAMNVVHGLPSGEAYYLLGRYHDGSQAWDKSIDAYRKAIAADARNVEAYNALGVALARRHRYDDAEATLRKAMDIAPNSAHVRSNLGFVLLIAGRPDEAIAELKAALKLDRENVTAHANLREALAQAELRQASRASGATTPASKPEATSLQATGSASSAPIASNDSAVRDLPAVVSLPAPVATVNVVGADVPVPRGLRVNDRPTVSAFSMHAGGLPFKTPDQPVPVDFTVPQAPLANARMLLELSNGNGVEGAAAQLKRWLVAEGLPVDRLSNRRPYDQQQTVIQYRAGQHEAALRVARTLGTPLNPGATPSTGLRSNVRVVLGHDWGRMAACLGNACERSTLVAAAQER